VTPGGAGACERGISHNEAERASAADLAAGARVLAEVMLGLD
jgi:N-carbamoyl-L-amino-acid hydrolase